MSSELWAQFMELLASDDGKLDEFLELEENEIESWLSGNGFTVSLQELAEAAPRARLDDGVLDDVSGGKLGLQGIRGFLLDIKNRSAWS